MAQDLNNLYKRREQIAFELIVAYQYEARVLQQELEEIEMEIEAYSDYNTEQVEEEIG